jgi:hypothetical protein
MSIKESVSKKLTNYPMVLVTWYDAKDGNTGWQSLEEVQNEKLALCHSMGWLVTYTKERTVIMADYSEYDEEKDGGRHIAIPTGWVKSIAYLEINRRETN